ncbi:hypothetical protein FCV63_11380 [Vibrio lentus]|nr:response regulator receiver domain [Vibrio lentus]TKF57556.1 hypothetical protein FCV63_11380 [Vibrio lentus]
MISSFRSGGRNWLCDVHDGKDISTGNTENQIVNHLHQSDLLILDYNLTSDHTDGSHALSLIRKISENTHFNLVVIYTKSNITDTFHEVLYNLVKRDIKVNIEDDKNMLFSLWELEDPTITSNINDLFSSTSIVEAINIYQCKKDIKKVTFYEQLEALYSEKPGEIELSIEDLFLQGLFNKYEEIKGSAHCEQFLKNEAFIDGDINWIKNDRLFVTVVDKNATEPEYLPEQLQRALESWNPKPLRLLMSKIRTELDGNGITFEDSILSNDYVLAGWLKDFVESSESESKWVAQKSIQQAMLSLSDSLQNQMESFSINLKTLLSTNTSQELVQQYHKLNILENDTKTTISSFVNANICSKEITGNQVKTGHVLQIDECFYMCLTPACDLVPGQSNDWKKALGSVMPVKLVKLIDEQDVFGGSPKSHQKILQGLNSNNYVVLNIGGKNRGLSYVKSSKDNPQWEQAFISSKGAINWEEGLASINLIRLSEFKIVEGSAEVSQPLQCLETKINVVAELRYEYALNFLQKFGMSQSRVGLDFQALR